jgi:hypothetical protein
VGRRINLDNLIVSQIRQSSSQKVIPFPLVFYRLGCMFHLDKETSRLVLQELERKRLIRIYDFHGVEVLKTRKS